MKHLTYFAGCPAVVGDNTQQRLAGFAVTGGTPTKAKEASINAESKASAKTYSYCF